MKDPPGCLWWCPRALQRMFAEVGADLATWHMGSAVSIRASERNAPKKGVRRASPGPCIHLFSATLWFLSDMFLVVLPYFPSLCWIDEHSLICTCPPLVGCSHFKWRQPLVGFASIVCTSKYPNFLTVKWLQLLIIAITRKSYCQRLAPQNGNQYLPAWGIVPLRNCFITTELSLFKPQETNPIYSVRMWFDPGKHGPGHCSTMSCRSMTVSPSMPSTTAPCSCCTRGTAQSLQSLRCNRGSSRWRRPCNSAIAKNWWFNRWKHYDLTDQKLDLSTEKWV